jgi:hypothetical protein
MMETKFKNIGQAVRALRKQRQLTLQQLANPILKNIFALDANSACNCVIRNLYLFALDAI